jgi:hypothetical protein
MKIFKEVFIANIKELIRDKSGMFWLIAFPIIFVFIFGLIFTGGSGEQSYTIGLVFEGDSPVNETIERSIRNVPVFNLSTNTRNEEIEALNSGRRELVMIVPEIDTDNIQEYNIEIFYKLGTNKFDIENNQIKITTKKPFNDYLKNLILLKNKTKTNTPLSSYIQSFIQYLRFIFISIFYLFGTIHFSLYYIKKNILN